MQTSLPPTVEDAGHRASTRKHVQFQGGPLGMPSRGIYGLFTGSMHARLWLISSRSPGVLSFPVPGCHRPWGGGTEPSALPRRV